MALTADGDIYTSGDAGENWTLQGVAPAAAWTAVASSADGNRLVAVASGGEVYTSADAGENWVARELQSPVADWTAVVSSANGIRLIVASVHGPMYASADGGATWERRVGGRQWSGLASSADGLKLVAGDADSGQILISTDAGISWVSPPGSPNSDRWSSAASSADGTILVAAVRGGPLHISTDGGQHWTTRESNRPWSSVVTSADGRKLVAAGLATEIFTSVPTTTPGPAGSLAAAQGSEIELQYVGNNAFRVVNSSGALTVEGAVVLTGLESKVSRYGDAMSGPLTNDAGFYGPVHGTFAGSFDGAPYGNGQNLRYVNASYLGGLSASRFWQAAGNSGSTAGVNFIGTTDDEPLELKVKGERALRLEPADQSPNLIGGSGDNWVAPGSVGATIVGGGRFLFPNHISAHFAAIGGGEGHTASGDYAQTT